METTTTILSAEHQHILKVISALLKECQTLQTGGDINKNFFEKAIDFVRGYADKFHHAKEEDILFLEFNKCAAEGGTHCNPVEQMLHEHTLGRDFIKKLEEGIVEDDKNKIIENAQGYAHLLQDHIYKEDNILYPMADEALKQEVKDAMLAKFKEVEQQRLSERDKYLLFVTEIEATA